jgi:hypothetical protein
MGWDLHEILCRNFMILAMTVDQCCERWKERDISMYPIEIWTESQACLISSILRRIHPETQELIHCHGLPTVHCC